MRGLDGNNNKYYNIKGLDGNEGFWDEISEERKDKPDNNHICCYCFATWDNYKDLNQHKGIKRTNKHLTLSNFFNYLFFFLFL